MARPRTHGKARAATVASLEPPKQQGRPRSSGSKKCDRCGRMAAKIRVHWPDGAICGICFTEALHTHGRCPSCGDRRLLPGRDADGEAICRDCAGITRPEMVCIRCGAEAERFRGGACARCVVTGDLEALLKPTNPPDLRLARLVHVLANVRRPESIYTWMRGKRAHELLTQIGERSIELTNESLDQLPRSPAVDHLRDILIHHRMIIAPEDRYLAIFERWLAKRLDELHDRPRIASVIEQYATWHHLSRLRMRIGAANMDIAARDARQQITEAGRFLIWVEDAKHLTVETFTQIHIDEYLTDAVSTRYEIKNFISWYAKNRSGQRQLYVPKRKAVLPLPSLTQKHRLQVIRNAIEFDQVALGTRVAALIHLLWATPLTRLVQLKVTCIELRPDGMRIALGRTPSEIPELLAPLFWQHREDRTNQQTTNVGTDWLFPGYRAGRHLSVPTLQQRFHVIGLDPQRTRNTTLKSLTGQIDVHSLAQTLGYAPKTLAAHAERAGIYMSRYVEAKRIARTPAVR
ncbi:hypothetical protein PTQ19_07530 [Microbacterium esteraromaticum]|uniref:hypothetical protein n=1 Tax=Microbacterium esteraromaticum TaxID=57043 RepID=UPI0023674CDA|nr:hypothetical protein [Microbacterium esteraromaticum]WDH77402.1 hypothetical protein PTQ19_07530 [Microbacterium esteraromaticum]